MPSGDAVANATVACDDSYKNKTTGEKVEKTEFVRVVFFGKLAEIVEKYLHKGSKVYVEGKLRTRKWQTQDGQDRYSTEVVVDIGGQMQMLDGKGGDGGNVESVREFDQPRAPYQKKPDFDDSIPF